MTFCPFCGVRIVVTLVEPAQVTIAHALPLCLQAFGAVESLTKAIARFQPADDTEGVN